MCVYIYIYICLSLYLSLSLYRYLYLYLSLSIYIYIYRHVYTDQGVRGFFRGSVPRLLFAAPSAAMCWGTPTHTAGSLRL